jgi:hypothetical protein
VLAVVVPGDLEPEVLTPGLKVSAALAGTTIWLQAVFPKVESTVVPGTAIVTNPAALVIRF